ncbi:hypothetical protein STEG23_023728 [Scotinomys teguina]
MEKAEEFSEMSISLETRRWQEFQDGSHPERKQQVYLLKYVFVCKMYSPLSLGIPIINHFKGYIFQEAYAGIKDVCEKLVEVHRERLHRLQHLS